MTCMAMARTSQGSSAATATSRPDDSRVWRLTSTLIDLRALDANGSGSDSTVIAAIQQSHRPAKHL